MRTHIKYIFLILFLVPCGIVTAQEFAITHVELAGDKLNVFYDLVDTVKDRHYTVHVYSSKDNYLNPLQQLSGDAGLQVVPGSNKKIIWNISEEFGADYKGKVGLGIRGRLYVPFVQFKGFQDYGVHKRGAPFVITWSGGTRQNVLNFDLYKGDKKVWTKPNVANAGHVSMTIPTSVKPGKGYKFRVSDTKNGDQIVFTSEFEVKRKIPLVLKSIPIILGGALITYLVTKKEDDPFTIANAPCPDENDCNN